MIYSICGISKNSCAINYWARNPDFSAELKKLASGGHKVMPREILSIMEKVYNEKNASDDKEFFFGTARKGMNKVRKAIEILEGGVNS